VGLRKRNVLADYDIDNERRGATDQALAYMEALLDLKRVRPGERLPSAAALSSEIGVSRPAVLQALAILARQNRITVKQGRGGTWVTEHEADNLDARFARAWEQRERIVEMSHLREILEAGAVRLAAERGVSRLYLVEARRLATAMRDLGDHTFTDIEQYLALDTELHLLLAKATGMGAISSAVAQARQEVAAAFDAIVVPGASKARSDDEHDELIDAIVRGDAAAAEVAARRHVSRTTGLLEKALSGGLPHARARTQPAGDAGKDEHDRDTRGNDGAPQRSGPPARRPRRRPRTEG
jgi:DNA-binding FadR family transcriptional regulator